MSTEIEQRVVEMRFDNARFEKNASTTLSTLDKLKKKLNFSGASKGLEDLGKAASKVNMTSLNKSADTVMAKFSALEVVGVTALANIANSAVNAGKRMLSALTIDPIRTGFSEYETQINAIQTILANTQSKGTTLDDVNQALDTLNTYADKTIYNFTEMTRNIGTFTAAGIDLDTSVKSIQGIANLAAVSGSTSQQASTAMYQLSQALASGTVKLMDWNSVVNAGMGGQVFQDALKETARVHGVAIDSMIEKEGSFRDTLHKEWLTAEILTETLEKFTMTTEGLTDAQIEQNRQMLRSKGYTDAQIDSIFELGKTATDAATKVKTFTQLWDTLKEAAQSGWTQTWELIVGDFEQSKSLLTSISDYVGNIINESAKKRNNLLSGALGKQGFNTANWDRLISKINEAGFSTDTFTEKLKEAAQENGVSLDDLIAKHGSLVKAFMSGELSTNIITKAIKKLTGANEELSEGLSKTNTYTVKTGDCLYTIAQQYGTTWQELYRLNKELIDNPNLIYAGQVFKVSEAQAEQAEQLAKLSDEQLKNKGYNEQQIKALRELEKVAEGSGESLNELVGSMDQLDGRTLLIGSFGNAAQGLVAIFTAVRDAWVDVFPPMTSQQLYNIIANIHEFSEHLRVGGDTADKLTRTFKGLFAILDIFTTLTGGGLKVALKVVTNLLGMVDVDILSLTASLGDAAVELRDFVDYLISMCTSLDGAKRALLTAYEALLSWLDGLGEAGQIGRNIIEGLVNGIIDGGSTAVDAIINVANMLIDAVKSVLGIHSPSTVFFAIGGFIIAGLIAGIAGGEGQIWDAIRGIGQTCIDAIGKIDWGAVFVAGISVATFATIKKLTDILDKFASPLEGLGDLFENLGGMFESIGNGLETKFKAQAWEARSKAVLNIAIAIGILAASLIALSMVDGAKILKAGVALIGLATALLMISKAAEKMSLAGDFKLSVSLIAIAGSLMIVAMAMEKLSGIKTSDVGSTLGLLAGIVVGLGALMWAMGAFIKGKTAQNVDKAGSMILKMSAALLLMTFVVKQAAKLAEYGDSVWVGLGIIGAIELMFIAIMAVSKIAGKNASKAGTMLLSMSAAMLIMVTVIKRISKISQGELDYGMAVIALIGGVFTALIGISKFAGANAAKAGTMLLTMSVALLVMTTVIKQIGKLDDKTIERGIVVIAGIEILFAAIIAVSKLAGENAMKAGVMLLAMSAAMLVMTGVLYLISKMDPSGLNRALGAVAVLEILFGGLIAVTKLAQNCKGTLIAMTVAVGILALVVGMLSLIKPDKLRNATAAITMVMSAFALMIASTKFAQVGGKMVGSLIAMSIVVGILAAIIAALSLTDPDSALPAAAAISLLLATLSASLLVVSKASPLAMASVGSLGAMVVVVGILAAILGVLAYMDVEPSIESASALSILLLGMSAACLIASKIPVGTGLAGALELAQFVGVMGMLLLALGAIAKIPFVNELVTGGGELLANIGYALGDFVGSIIGGFSAGATSGLPAIGENLKLFMQHIAEIDPTAIDGAKALAEMLVTLTAASFLDAVTSWLTGGNSVTDFAKQLVPFGEALVEFSNTVKGNVDQGAVEAAANAGMIMAEMADTLPKMGGLAAAFAGENDMGVFGTQLVTFGKSITEFSNTVKGNVDQNAVEAAAAAGDIMISMADSIPNSGGLVALFAGDNDMGTFGRQLCVFGSSIAEFSGIVAGNINADAVTAAANAGMIMVSLANTIPKSGGIGSWFSGDSGLGKFGDQIVDLATSLKKFSDKASEIDITSMNTAVSAVSNIATAMSDIGDTGIDAFLQSFAEAETKLITAGEDIVDSLVSGLEDTDSDLTTAAENMLTDVIDAIEDVYWDFYDAGEYLVEGFAAGIDGKTWYAEAKAKAMANAALDAAEKALDVNSPSREFYRVGSFAGEGFVNAFVDYESKAFLAGSSIAKYATSGLTKAVSQISRIVGSDIDSQPVIRPVIDLSEVRTGINAMGGMFGMNPSVGVLASVKSINSMMNRRQNGGNADVISAIGDLGRKLGNIRGNTYSINGVTISNNAEVEEAFRIITRAAQVERRR